MTPTRQSGDATLVEPDFGRVNTAIDTVIDESNQNKVLRVSFPTAAEDTKVTSYPGWAHRPSQVFDDIKQVTTDSMGNVTQVEVQPDGELVLYAYKALGHRRWDMCVANHFYNHLAPKSKDHLSLTYTPGVIARDPSTQTRAIQ